jgi:inward rectifier potassium channel
MAVEPAMRHYSRDKRRRRAFPLGHGLPEAAQERGMDDRRDPRIHVARVRGEKAARVRFGAYEFEKKGISRFDLRDPYHLAVALTWPQFLAALLALYLAVNLVFATLFWVVPGSVANARPDSFADVFFFSMETLATVGYGEMHPATPYGRVVAAGEIVCGLAFTAILTGLTFVRFSRPRAKLVFAANPVVAMYNGKPMLMVRIGNGRAAILTDAAAKLNVLLSETTAEGKLFRRAQELRLERMHLPIFPLTWTLMHALDERSPLHGYDAARAIEADARLFVTLEARDPTLATMVHDIRSYAPGDIRFGMRYADVITTAQDRTPVGDLSRIGALEPDVGDHEEQGWTAREEEPQ